MVYCLSVTETVNGKGVIGLVKVTADLVTKGYEVFSPISDHSPVDLVAGDSSMRLSRVQVKYRKIDSRGLICVSLDSVVNGKRVPVDTSKIDCWAIHCPNLETIYYVRRSDMARRGIRIVPSKDNAGMTDPARIFGE